MHSSQNEQDSRHYAIAAKLPMVEPSDSQECIDFIKAAYEISETYDTPVIFRTCTRIAHSQSIIKTAEREERPLRDYVKDPKKYVMMPGNAIGRHVFVEERMKKLAELAETTPLNRVELAGRSVGFITSGTCYQYVKEAFPEASVLKLGLVNPLPERLIRDFAAQVETLYIVEELDPVIETHCRAIGVRVDGGKDRLGLLGEYSQREIAAAFGAPVPECDTTVCMGASISGLHGFNKARGRDSAKKSVAVIGDSTFMHSGITGLINITYNLGNSTVIVLDNSITGMTGHQQNPTPGLTLKNQPTPQVSIEKICEAAGVRRVRVVDPNELKELEQVVREELEADEPSVIIARRPCVLLKYVKHAPPFVIDDEKCKKCKACMRIGCPAISITDGRVVIDDTLCVGCDLCTKLCSFGAIKSSEVHV